MVVCCPGDVPVLLVVVPLTLDGGMPVLPTDDVVLLDVLEDDDEDDPVPDGPTGLVAFTLEGGIPVLARDEVDEELLEELEEDEDDVLEVPPVQREPVPVGPHELVPLLLSVTACTVSEQQRKRNRKASMA